MEEYRVEKEPYVDYCFHCGIFTEIDEKNKLCKPCIDSWIGLVVSKNASIV